MIEAMIGGTALVESMHGAGSPQAQRVMIFRERELGATNCTKIQKGKLGRFYSLADPKEYKAFIEAGGPN